MGARWHIAETLNTRVTRLKKAMVELAQAQVRMDTHWPRCERKTKPKPLTAKSASTNGLKNL
jgi:hypothetical protein